MIILDTDILSQLQRNNARVLQRLEASNEEVFIRLITKKATLVTRNTKDFSKISGLKIENWMD